MGPTQLIVAGIQRRTTWSPRPFFSSLSLFCWSSVVAGMAWDVGTNPGADYQLTLSSSGLNVTIRLDLVVQHFDVKLGTTGHTLI